MMDGMKVERIVVWLIVWPGAPAAPALVDRTDSLFNLQRQKPHDVPQSAGYHVNVSSFLDRC